MIKTLVRLIACFCLFSTAQAQLFEIEAFVSGGSNLPGKVEALAEGYRQAISPTFHAQGNIGVRLTQHIGVGAGLCYYPISSRRIFALPQLESGNISVDGSSLTYHRLPHVYAWYSFGGKGSFFPNSRVTAGVMRATTSGYFRAVVTSQSELADNRILYDRWESLSSPHTFLAAEARFDVDLFRAGNHQLSGGIHVVKGFATVFTVTHEYSVGSLLFDQRSHLEIQGDYVGFGISYRWGVGIPKKDFWKRRRGQYK